MDRHRIVTRSMHALAGTLAAALAGPALADVSVNGAARVHGPPTGTNDFHVVYDSTLGAFQTTAARARDSQGNDWPGAPGTPPPGSSPTAAQHNFNRPPQFTNNFSWLEYSLQIRGTQLCSMRILDKYWTRDGVRLPKRVGGFGMLQDTDPATGNTRVWVLNDHDDLYLRVHNVTLDIFSSANLPDVWADLELSTPYTYSIPVSVLGPGDRVSFTFNRALAPDEWSAVQGTSELWDSDTQTWIPDGNFRYQHEYLPAPGTTCLLAFGGLIGTRRRRA